MKFKIFDKINKLTDGIKTFWSDKNKCIILYIF